MSIDKKSCENHDPQGKLGPRWEVEFLHKKIQSKYKVDTVFMQKGPKDLLGKYNGYSCEELDRYCR